MIRNEKNNWKPSPTMLAAYADGEFEGRDDLAALKTEIEAYLTEHPDAVDDLAGYRSLRNVWHDTTPHKPNAAKWDAVLHRIRGGTAAALQRKSTARRWQLWAGTVAAAAVLIATAVIWYTVQDTNRHSSILPTAQGSNDLSPMVAAKTANEPLPVASMEEVEILSVDGDDIPTLIVGTLPVEGLLEPADAGDVSDFRIPDEENNILVVNAPDGRPMIIAQID